MTVLTTPRESPASRKEQAQWMLHKVIPERGICNIGFALRIDRSLRWWPLQEALNHVVRRHPALRAVLRATGSQLRKHYLSATDTTAPLDTLAGTEDGLDAQISSLVATPLDIETGPLLHAYLIMLPEGSAICVALHHLIADAITAQVVMREMITLYEAFADGRSVPPELAGTGAYHDEAEPDDATVAYWAAHLDGIDPSRSALAGARPVHGKPTFTGDRIERSLTPAAVAAVSRLRATTRTTDNIVLLAAFYLLLAQHGAGPDLAVGVPVNGRRGAIDAEVVGYHANTLPVRVAVDFGADFRALAAATRDAFLSGLEHGTASFESVQHTLGARSAEWRVPLFRHSFNFRPTELGGMTLAGAPVRVIDAYQGTSRLDLELIAMTRPGAINLIGVFSTEVHDRADLAILLERYEHLLVALADNAGLRLSELDSRTPADRALAARVNDTERGWPAESVPELIAEHTQRNPDAIAVGAWTYRRLSAAAGGVREQLRDAGVTPGDVVGLHAHRGPLLAAAVLGVWAAGAAYLPLDPLHPSARIEHQLTDAGVRVLLADEAPPDSVVGDRAMLLLAETGAAPMTAPTTGSLAYVIYTSGSTGRPKGVEVTHANLSNLVRHFAEALTITPSDRMLWLTTFSFDISALELFVPLAVGARVVVADDEARLDAAVLIDLIRAERVTVAQATPTTWRHLAARFGDALRGRRVLCGGEPMTAVLAEQLLAAGAEVFNVYGPTETTIWSTLARLRSPVPDLVPIGTPIANTTVHVLDSGGRPVLPGVPGELCVGGAGVALGYRGDPERTAQRFREHQEIGRYYATGDQVRQRPDGELEFLGRTDRQVKVRGHRIELIEIETVLEEHPQVRAAAVFTETDPDGHPRLVAAIESTQAEETLAQRLRAHAAERLPAATVPGRFVVVSEFPLTGNGKIDYPALAAATADHGPGPELPTDPTVRTLVELWRTVLGDERLSSESNFFLSGGHSLAAVRLAELASAAIGTDIGFDAIFAAPTPVQLATRLGAS